MFLLTTITPKIEPRTPPITEPDKAIIKVIIEPLESKVCPKTQPAHNPRKHPIIINPISEDAFLTTAVVELDLSRLESISDLSKSDSIFFLIGIPIHSPTYIIIPIQ